MTCSQGDRFEPWAAGPACRGYGLLLLPWCPRGLPEPEPFWRGIGHRQRRFAIVGDHRTEDSGALGIGSIGQVLGAVDVLLGGISVGTKQFEGATVLNNFGAIGGR